MKINEKTIRAFCTSLINDHHNILMTKCNFKSSMWIDDSVSIFDYFVMICVSVGLAVMSVDFGSEFMKIAIVKVCTTDVSIWMCIIDVQDMHVIIVQL